MRACDTCWKNATAFALAAIADQAMMSETGSRALFVQSVEQCQTETPAGFKVVIRHI